MSAIHLDLNDYENLNKLVSLATDKPDSANNLYQRFPLHQLSEVPLLNTKVITTVLKSFELFQRHCNLNPDLMVLMRFCSNAINFQGNIEECDFVLLEKLLRVFKFILNRELQVRAVFTCDALLTTLHSIAHHPEVPRDVLDLAVEVFSSYLQRPFVKDSHFGKVCSGMWKAAEKLTITQRLGLLRSLLCNDNIQNNPDIDASCHYLIDVIKKLYQGDFDLIGEVLKCILDMYEKYKNKSTIMALSVQLASVNFPKCLSSYFLGDIKYFPKMHEIIYYEISTIFAKTPWNSANENLRETITNLGEAFLIKPDPGSDRRPEFMFLMFYLELLYKKITNRQIPIIKDMITLFLNKIPTNPALLKSIYLLFAAYGGTELEADARSLQCDLLLTMQHCDNLESYLSYHVAELIWVLRFGSWILKKKVVAAWLRQTDSDLLGYLSRCLKECDQQKCLLEVVCSEDTADVRSKAMNIFLFCAPNSRQQLIPLLMRPDLTVESLGCIMNADPAEIILGEPNDYTYKEDLNTLRAMIIRLIDVLTQESILIPEKTKAKLFVYLLKCCKEIRQTEYKNCFVVKKLSTLAVKIITGSNQVMASQAFQFLMLLVTSQVDHKILYPEPTVVESRPLLGVEPKLACCAVKFYEYILKSRNTDISQIVVLNSYLQLYHNLLEVLTGTLSAMVFPLVVHLLEKYETCVSSFMNIAAIRTYCREVCTNEYFVKYLSVWYQTAIAYKYIKIPVRSIIPLIKHLDSIKYTGADYAVLKTIKC